jgi:conjugative transposon TraN protein
MKNTAIFAALLPILLHAQQPPANLKTVYINRNISTHFACPDPVEYIDLSTNCVTGDIPAKNMVRIKPDPDSANVTPTILTIVGQKYLVRYRLISAPANQCQPYIDVSKDNVAPVDDPNNPMSESELTALATKVLNTSQHFNAVATYEDRMEAKVVSIVTKGGYFFIKLRLRNHTNIVYDIDQVRFSIDDRKVLKATNNQSIEVKPLCQSTEQTSFRRTWENVYVFKKFTFPGIKDFAIRIAEKQTSGRQITIHVSYSDILNADAL